MIQQVLSTKEFIHCQQFLYTKYREQELTGVNYTATYFDKHFMTDNRINMYYIQKDGKIESTISYKQITDGRIFDVRIDKPRFIHAGLLASNRLSSTIDIMALCYHIRAHYNLDVIIGINPRHVPFYSRVFGFLNLGQHKYGTLPMVIMELPRFKHTRKMDRYRDNGFDHTLFNTGMAL